jgi:hypothetical protein
MKRNNKTKTEGDNMAKKRNIYQEKKDFRNKVDYIKKAMVSDLTNDYNALTSKGFELLTKMYPIVNGGATITKIEAVKTLMKTKRYNKIKATAITEWAMAIIKNIPVMEYGEIKY